MKYYKIVFCSFLLLANRSATAGSTGDFQPAPGSPFAAGNSPIWVAYSPIVQGNVFTAVANETSASVTVYSLDTATGALTQVSGSPFATGVDPAAVAFTPVVEQNLFAAIPNFFPNNLSVYQVDQSTGAFTQVSGSPFATGNSPNAISFSPVTNGNLFAAVTNEGSPHSVSLYLVNQSTGQFTQVSGSPFSLSGQPIGVSFSPIVSGNLFLAISNNNGTISVYLVDQSTGSLTQVPGSPFATGSMSLNSAYGISYSPLAFGQLFLAVTNLSDNTVSMYSVDQTTGALTEVSGSPFATGSNPDAVSFSPYLLGNLFTAVTNQTNNTVSVYQVDLTTGALTQLTDSPFATGTLPNAVAYSPVIAGKLFAAVANFDSANTSAYQVITAITASPILLAIFNKYC